MSRGPLEGRNREYTNNCRVGERAADASAMESERFVSGIHFAGALAYQNATGEVRACHAVAGIAEREDVMGKIAMGADVRQAVSRPRVVGRPAVLRLYAGDLWI